MAPVNLADALLYEHLRHGCGERLAVWTAAGPLTYAQLADRVDEFARAFRASGIRRGDRVVLRLNNDETFIAAWLAAQKTGGVAVATSPALRARELAEIVIDAEPALCVVAADKCDEVRLALPRLHTSPVVVTAGAGHAHGGYATIGDLASGARPSDDIEVGSEDDLAILSYVSDVSATPKGIGHTARQILCAADAYARMVIEASPDDVFGGTPPLWFPYGLGSLLVFPLRFAAATVPLAGFTADQLLQSIGRCRMSLLFGTATAYRLLLQVPDLEARFDLGSLRLCVSAGEHLDRATSAEWMRRTGRDLLDGLGTTEMFHIFLSGRRGDVVPGSLGEAVPGYELQLVGESPAGPVGLRSGMLAVRGPTRGRPWPLRDAGTPDAGDGWSVTGDIVARDADGRYWFEGRSDGLIVSAGYNVSGAEVEGVLRAHPSVAAAVVAGAPDPVRGAVVKAFVAWKPEVTDGALALAALREHAQRELASYKCPRDFVEFDARSLNVASKIETGDGRLDG